VTAAQPPECGTPITHPEPFHQDGTPVTEEPARCALPKGHETQIEDSPHADGHACLAPVLVHQSTIREVARVAREWPDGIHTCAELQRLEPGRRPCTCGRCPQ
jgi:hypothetical protein